jgi:hypothetical protein
VASTVGPPGWEGVHHLTANTRQEESVMNRNAIKVFATPAMLGACLLAAPGLALAANVHLVTGMPGQPSQTIGTPQTGSITPGHAAEAPGSAFNPNGNAGSHYAGNQPQNSKNPKSVSQYDQAGFQQSHKPHQK